MRNLMIFFVVASMAGVASQRAVAQAEAESYRFIGGEKIELRFEPVTVGEMKEQVISDDGTATLPTGSTVSIKGKTSSDAKAIIAEQMKKDTGAKFVQVRILVLEYPARRIVVSGEVRTPKAISLMPGVPMTLLFALQEAGGITDQGDPACVKLLRTDTAGVTTTQHFDTVKLAQEGNLGPKLIAGDVITVCRGDHYTFTGEFNRIGMVTLGELHLEQGEQPILSRVIAGLGGVKKEADLRKLKILRLRPDGKREVLTPLADAASEKDPLLKSSDMIDVPAKLSQRETLQVQSVTVLGKVKTPGTFPIGENGLKLSKLILLAGGTTEFAKAKRVTINRPSEKGRLITVDVDSIIKKGAWDQDVELKDGDIVDVPERAY